MLLVYELRMFLSFFSGIFLLGGRNMYSDSNILDELSHNELTVLPVVIYLIRIVALYFKGSLIDRRPIIWQKKTKTVYCVFIYSERVYDRVVKS